MKIKDLEWYCKIPSILELQTSWNHRLEHSRTMQPAGLDP